MNSSSSFLIRVDAASSRASIAAVVSGVACIILATMLVAFTPWPGRMDHWLLALMVHGRTSPQTAVAQFFTWLGSGPTVIAVAAMLAAVLWLGTRRMALPGALLGTVACAVGSETLMKLAVARPRPPVDVVIGVPSASYAFPSGHTTNGTAVYVMGALLLATMLRSTRLRAALLASAVVIALGIGWSRLYLGFHWLSDVLGGWLLAATVIAAATTMLAAWRGPAISGSEPGDPSAADLLPRV